MLIEAGLWHLELVLHYEHQLAALAACNDTDGGMPAEHYERHQTLAEALRKIENARAIELRDQDRISDEVFRTLQRELDLLSARDAGS